jgi:hypothetical protein
MIVKLRNVLLALVSSSVVLFANCSPKNDGPSKPLVTDIEHTSVKRQSIGNCWLYAHATWLESLLLEHSGEAVDVSESYWTWWHWYDEITNYTQDQIDTGGSWYTSSSIILRHGWVSEKDFIPEESGMEMSTRQAEALKFINQALDDGDLDSRNKRTPENVRKVLDQAFGTNMTEAEARSRSAATTMVGEDATLEESLNGSEKGWIQRIFPGVSGKDRPIPEYIEEQRKVLLKRVLNALNDKKPVVMSLMIDFNAFDREDQTFKKSLVDNRGIGSQGSHLVVLEDYTVKNAPGFGEIGEGDVSDAMKQAALEGEIVTFKAKNSWGTNRADRGLTDGYTRFDAAYLFSQLEWKAENEGDENEFATTLRYFVIPPGY